MDLSPESGYLVPGEAERSTRCLGCRQFSALVGKNFRLKRRSWCQTLAELISPVAIAGLFVLGFSLSSETTTHPTLYANATGPLTNLARAIKPTLVIPTNDSCCICLPPYPYCIDKAKAEYHQKEIQAAAEDLTTGYYGPLPIPNLNEFFQASAVAQMMDIDIPEVFNLVHMGRIAFAPDTQEVRDLYERLRYTWYGTFDALDAKIYETADDAVNAALQTTNKDDQFWAVLVVFAVDISNDSGGDPPSTLHSCL
eukprot:jgi/Bigna1/129489/aug1.9_g4197